MHKIIFEFILPQIWEGSHCSIMAKVLDSVCKISEFKLALLHSLSDKYTRERNEHSYPYPQL